MGTLFTPSPPTPGSGGIAEGVAGTFSDDNHFAFPQNGYVDHIHVYVGAQSGSTTCTAVIYRTDTGAIIATSNSVGSLPSGHAWVSFPLASPLFLPTGYSWAVGVFGTPNIQVGNNTGTGNYWFSSGSSPATWEAGSKNVLGFAGQLYYYLEYSPSQAYVNTGTPGSPVWTAAQVYVNTGTPASPVWTPATEIDVNTGTPASPVWTPGG